MYLGLRGLSLTLVSPCVVQRWLTLGLVGLSWAFVGLRWVLLGLVRFRLGDVGSGGGFVQVDYFK